MDSAEHQQEIQKALEIFMELPQAGHISESQVNEFIDSVVQIGESPVWHMNRLAWIGPSEAGFLVATYLNSIRGPGDSFINSLKDARDVVLQKLMRVMPEEVPATRRGKRMERVAKQFFIEDMEAQGFTVTPATKELDILKAARIEQGQKVDPERPWLPIPSIDDLVYVTSKETGERKLVLLDYKCPSADMHSSLMQDVGVAYTTQLHLYRHGLKQLGINIDEMALAPFNYEDASVPYVPVEYDPELESIIFQACDRYYYDAILTGQIPPRVSTAQEAYNPEEVPEDAYDNGALYAAASAVEEEAGKIKRAAQQALKETFKNVQTYKQTVVSLGATNVSLKPVYEYDVDEIHRMAEEYGVEVGKKDTEEKLLKKIEKAATTKGHAFNVDNFRSVVHAVTIRSATGNKSGAHLMRGVKQDAVPFAGHAIEQLQTDLKEILDVIKESARTEQERLDYVTVRNEAILGLSRSNDTLVNTPTEAPPHVPTIKTYEASMTPPDPKADLVRKELADGAHHGNSATVAMPDEELSNFGGFRM